MNHAVCVETNPPPQLSLNVAPVNRNMTYEEVIHDVVVTEAAKYSCSLYQVRAIVEDDAGSIVVLQKLKKAVDANNATSIKRLRGKMSKIISTKIWVNHIESIMFA